jgi:hypothetical protein
MHWRERYETPLAVRDTGPTVTKLWLVMAACLGVTLILAAVLT